MAKEKFVITLLNPETHDLQVYGSIEALCNDPDCMIVVSSRTVHLMKEETGYPVKIYGCVVDRKKVWTKSELMYKQKQQELDAYSKALSEKQGLDFPE